MNKGVDTFLNLHNDIFGFFDQVFLFGSYLCHDRFNDIDILLVYESASASQVNLEKEKVESALASKFADDSLHITVLSKSELRQTGFLAKVPHRKIKG